MNSFAIFHFRHFWDAMFFFPFSFNHIILGFIHSCFGKTILYVKKKERLLELPIFEVPARLPVVIWPYSTFFLYPMFCCTSEYTWLVLKWALRSLIFKIFQQGSFPWWGLWRMRKQSNIHLFTFLHSRCKVEYVLSSFGSLSTSLEQLSVCSWMTTANVYIDTLLHPTVQWFFSACFQAKSLVEIEYILIPRSSKLYCAVEKRKVKDFWKWYATIKFKLSPQLSHHLEFGDILWISENLVCEAEDSLMQFQPN